MMFPTKYDNIIKDAVKMYCSTLGWLWLKAQLYQESLLNPDVVSPVGAQGIAQFMPTTWPEVCTGMNAPPHVTPFQPEYAIPGAAWYMSQLYWAWCHPLHPRPVEDHLYLTLASYNTGLGNMLHAQKLAENKISYVSILSELPKVTGIRAYKETQNYVTNIISLHKDMAAQEVANNSGVLQANL